MYIRKYGLPIVLLFIMPSKKHSDLIKLSLKVLNTLIYSDKSIRRNGDTIFDLESTYPMII